MTLGTNLFVGGGPRYRAFWLGADVFEGVVDVGAAIVRSVSWSVVLRALQTVFFAWIAWNSWRLRRSEKGLLGPRFSIGVAVVSGLLAAVNAVFFVQQVVG